MISVVSKGISFNLTWTSSQKSKMWIVHKFFCCKFFQPKREYFEDELMPLEDGSQFCRPFSRSEDQMVHFVDVANQRPLSVAPIAGTHNVWFRVNSTSVSRRTTFHSFVHSFIHSFFYLFNHSFSHIF